MAPHERGGGCSLKALLVVTLVMLGCISATTLTLDVICVNNLTQRLPLYPGATVQLERYNFLRPLGVGETILLLETDDDVDVVREWYAAAVGRAIRTATDSGNHSFFTIGSGSYSVTRAEEGSEILLHGVCMN